MGEDMVERFTPGPWSVVDNSWEVSTVYGPDGETVAECPINSTVLEDTQHIWEPIKEANAQLIATTPNLLRALKGAVAAWDRLYGSLRAVDTPDCAEDDEFGAMQVARAAITAALGGEGRE